MSAGRTTLTALKALRRNPLRALLTTLGIVIGVGAVIAMMEIGAGSAAAVQRSIASMGANVLMIMPGTASSGGVSFGAGSVNTLTPGDAEQILRDCPSLETAAPVVRSRTQVVHGNRNWVPSYLYGSTPAYLEVRDLAVMEGEMFSDRDVQNGARVCLLGPTLVRELFEDESPLGREIRVKNVAFKVIGVLEPKGANMMGMDQDDILLAPWTTIKYRVSGSSSTASAGASEGSSTGMNTLSNLYPGGPPRLYPERSAAQAANHPMPVRFANVDQIFASARSTPEIPVAIAEIHAVLRDRHGIRPGAPDDYNIRDMAEMSKSLTETTALMTNLLLSVAMISLLVGGVGIMNIMLVSVTERTREIGLRMAVGARAADILRQFLVEAVVLCLVGGLLGIGLGHGGSRLVGTLLGWPVLASPAAMLASFGVAAAVGVVFGFYPAWRASRLDPIEALRFE